MGHLLFYILVTCSQLFVCIHGMLQEAVQAAVQRQQTQQRLPTSIQTDVRFDEGQFPFPPEYGGPAPFPIGYPGDFPQFRPYPGLPLPFVYNPQNRYNVLPAFNNGGIIRNQQVNGVNGEVVRSSGEIVKESENIQEIGLNTDQLESDVNQQGIRLNSLDFPGIIDKIGIQGPTRFPYPRTDASGRPIYTISDLCRLLSQGILPGNIAVQPVGQSPGLERVIQDAINGAQRRRRHNHKRPNIQSDVDNGEGGLPDIGQLLMPGQPFGRRGPYDEVHIGPNVGPLGPDGPDNNFGPTDYHQSLGPTYLRPLSNPEPLKMLPETGFPTLPSRCNNSCGTRPFPIPPGYLPGGIGGGLPKSMCTPISGLLLPPMCPTGYLLTSMPTVLGLKCMCVPMPVPANSGDAIGSPSSNSWSSRSSTTGQISSGQISSIQSLARSLDVDEKK